MSADQTTALTVRDVLSQVDRRIDLVETDIRKLDSKFDSKFGAMDAKFRQLTTTIIAVAGILVASAGAIAAYLKV